MKIKDFNDIVADGHVWIFQNSRDWKILELRDWKILEWKMKIKVFNDIIENDHDWILQSWEILITLLKVIMIESSNIWKFQNRKMENKMFAMT